MTTWRKRRGSWLIRFDNRVTVELTLNKAGDALGLGAVRAGKVPLRNGAIPLRPWLWSVQGVDYTRFQVLGLQASEGGGVAVETVAHGIPRHEEAYGDESNDRLFRLSASDAPVEDRLTWLLRPETLELDGLTYQGFSYAWTFASQTQKLHRLISVATWEIGGAATGNTILSQGQVTPPVYTAERDTHFTSACLKAVRDFGKPQGMSFQWTPRWGLHQCFDFLASDAGTLLGYWPDKADVRSFVLKNPGEDVFFFADAMHWRAISQVETPRKCILFAPAGKGGLPEHAQRNRWLDAHEYCAESARSHFGIRRSRPLPERTLPYHQRLEKDGRFLMQVGEKWVPSQDWLTTMADDYFPRLAAQGVKRVIPEPISESDPTQRGSDCKLRNGIHGDFIVGSCCCTHRYRPAEFWGGMRAWKYFYDKAHAHGMEAGIWISGHMAWNSPAIREHPDWALRGFNTLPQIGGYPNFEAASLNLNSGVRAWILDDLRRWKEEGGLDYVWFDSLGNLTLQPVDYSREMETNAFAVGEFMAELQNMGIPNIAVEGVSPFGLAGTGIFDADLKTMGGAQGFAGQNCWEWFEGNEDMLYLSQPRPAIHNGRTEENARRRLFRCLANRCVPEMSRYVNPLGEGAAWFKQSIATYLAVEPDLVKRRLLPDRQGVLWTGGKADVLFAFAPVVIDVPRNARIARVHGETTEPAPHDGKLSAEPWCVYRLTK